MSGVDEAVQRIRGRLGRRVESRALRGQDIAINLHETAPRGGVNINRHGEPRSAPGEPPAIEDGDLLASMRDGPTFEPPLKAFIVANYVVLEFGTVRIDPRPIGRMTSEQLKQEVPGGA